MTKRTIEFEDKTIRTWVFLVGAVFSAWMFIDAMYIDDNELALDQSPQNRQVESVEEDFRTRILMSESTRYAQVAKYYRDEMKARELSVAEQARLDLVEREQCRIRNELVQSNAETCN